MLKKSKIQKLIKIEKDQRTVTNLLQYQGSIYVYLQSEAICKDFFRQAEYEGFRFGDQKPTEKETDNLIRLYHNHQLGYCGFCGRLFFGGGNGITESGSSGDSCICRIDYFRYITGEKDYLYYKKQFSEN
ncbi:MAG: hypothetical protein ACI4W6_01645 [Acutalibacteraceae bacterium]